MAISCEDPGRIGLIVNSDNGVISTHYQDMVIPASMVQFNLRKTEESTAVQAGRYTNPDFGIVSSMTYSQLHLAIVLQPAPDAEYVSFEVELGFNSFIGEDPGNNIMQSIDVYQLAEELDTLASYNRLDTVALNPAPLGTWVFAPKVNDVVQTDTSYIVTLDDAVGEDLFQKYLDGNPIFDSDAAFNAYFKGVAFVPTLDTKEVFQISVNTTTFRLNYNEFNSDGTPINRMFEMFIGSTGFYHIDSDITGTPISGIQPDNNEFDPGDNYMYLQYGTLMAIRGDLTPFYALTDTLENMIINKAEIYIGGIKQYDGSYDPPTFLQVYFTDETNVWPVVDNIGRYDTTQVGVNFIMVQDELDFVPPGAYYSPLSTFYNADDFNYRMDMSVFFQQLYSGDYLSASQPFLEEKAQIYIFGETDPLFPQNTGSSILSTPMAIHKDSIRLRIHYTIPTTINNN